MVKFLSGSNYNGQRVQVCTYWREDRSTDVTEDFAQLSGASSGGQCIANAFFAIEDISCFNSGQCNGEGKCLPCTKYRYDGMQIGITHSPPIDILRQFNKGITEEEIQSPNLVDIAGPVINLTSQDQIPYHILLRNIQAQITKCCHWNLGDGEASRFFLASIINGTVTREITDESGNTSNVAGIVVTNSVFPDEVGSFFPVGSVVVAGFEDQPSFYLEPRTGLIKPGEGVIFTADNVNNSQNRTKQAATASTRPVIDGVNSAAAARNAALVKRTAAANFLTNANSTNDPATIASAQSDFDTADENFTNADAASTAATTLGTTANTQIVAVVEAPDRTTTETAGQSLEETLSDLAGEIEAAAAAVGGTSEADEANAQVVLLRRQVRQLQVSAFGAFSKCEFFINNTNIAEQWNNPQDGTLPCNGIRPDCKFYTGPTFQFATEEKMEIGKPITGEQIQEIRFFSDDWTRFDDPNTEFERRFSTPFIWAFKGYVDVTGIPEVEDMLLYRPKILFGRDDGSSTYETMQVEKVEVSNFVDFSVAKSRSRVLPGSPTLDLDRAPEFPTLISDAEIPVNNKLSITHPREEDGNFIYRIWSFDKNKITIFGTSTDDVTIYLVNETALRNRQRYHTFYDSQDLFTLPSSLPGSPTFTNIPASQLLPIFENLEFEDRLNQSEAVLGFSKVQADRTGFWQSIQELDLVHNEINTIYAFLLINDTDFIFDSVQIDCRFLHSYITQTTFNGVDFSINDTIGTTKLGTNSGNTNRQGEIQASPIQVVGAAREPVSFSQGYYGWRFKNRNLQLGSLPNASDLQGASSIADSPSNFLVTESDATSFISTVAYQVVQYRKTVTVADWYLINDCGFIMIRLDDLNVHRVLPLPNAPGEVEPLTNVLLNGGSTGSAVAQWAIESATLTFKGEEKRLVQFYRDTDGFGLPANYVVLGPALEVEEAFGRPDPDRDSIEITFTFLRPQTVEVSNVAGEAELAEEVVSLNFYDDNLRGHGHKITFEEDGTLIAGGTTTDTITNEQQEYVWVFKDTDGRPIGKKYSRLMLMYYNLAAINVEIFYQWTGLCTTYALIPDVNLNVGREDGTLIVPIRATIDPDDPDLFLGFRVANLLGERDCVEIPSCGDHEFLRLGPFRREFEVIAFGQTDSDGNQQFPGGKAFYPSAGQGVPPGNTITEPPGSQFLLRRGPMWYPYNVCERPRYNFRTNGPLFTDSTELINEEIRPPGITAEFVQSNIITSNAGEFGNLKPREDEAYRGPDRVVPRILDIHPSLFSCTSAYTYGNQVLTGGESLFSGYARRRGEVDPFWFQALQWTSGPFGNFGRPRLVFEVTEKRGDYLGGASGGIEGFRWMPMFPEREDLGANIGLFSEDLEPQHYRLLAISNPTGPLAETIDTNNLQRLTHKSLIANRTAAAIEYPFSPYFPMFIPDVDLGKEPSERGAGIEEGDRLSLISTMWAWREQESPIQRGVQNSPIFNGIQLQSPEYFLDNRRLEVQLRPDEAIHSLKYRAPTYDINGSLVTNATLQLNDGPVREIAIDFETQKIEVQFTPDTFYDTSQDLGEGVFECSAGTPTDNLLLAQACSCIQDITDEDFATNQQLPARFLHLDELTPAGFFALYSSSTIETPFAVDVTREEPSDPCCICLYYTRGIFFKIDHESLPALLNIDPAFSSSVNFSYTWSRVPHGFFGGVGQDGIFAGQENLIENLLEFRFGSVFTKRFITGTKEVDISLGDVSAIFPSPVEATNSEETNQPITVSALPAGDPLLKGGVPATDNISQGESETIILDIVFDTYVQINSVTIGFMAGRDRQVPQFQLGIVDPSNRTGNPTLRTSRIIGESSRTAAGTDIPNSDQFSSQAIRNGEALFTETLIPSYANVPFWNRYGQEFHLIFGRRDDDKSMGIAFIELEIDALADIGDQTEFIFTPERRYYTSSSPPNSGRNPEQFLGELDSATGYWRTTEETALQGGNRFRSYAWGTKINDNQPPIFGEIEEIELLQKEEYDAARNLLESPYRFEYDSFIPVDEQNIFSFLGEVVPSWNLTMTMLINNIEAVLVGNERALYGEVPERERWNAPGHAWTFDFDETFAFCKKSSPKEMLIDFQFAHLHDGLAIVETARFWDELPSGLTRLIRSTLLSPDVTFGQTNESGVGITGATQDTVLLPASAFLDSQGNPISPEVIENAGFSQSEDGTFILFDNRGV